MKRVNRILFTTFALIMAWSSTMSAAVQVVTGAGTTPINGDGIADGVSFTAQGVTPSTLSVGNGESVNTNNNAAGVGSDSPGTSTVTFIGTTGTSNVNGSVGATNTLLKINAGLGSSTINFNGVVSTATLDVTGNGTVQFNTTANAALQFNTDGNMIVGGGATFNGAVTNLAANNGTLTLNSASLLNGAVGGSVGPLKRVNVVGGNATINGALSATTFNLGTNTLFLNGALALPVNTVINTTLISDTLFGNIFMPGQNDNITAALVTINVDATSALLTGAPLFVVNAGAGSSGVPITVTSNNIRYTFIGNNLNGSITIIPTLIPASDIVTNPSAGPVGDVLDALIPIAVANPGSDLAFVLTQLTALPTVAEYQDALLQIAPTSGLIGVGRESFNTTKQFQKVWLEHLLRNRCLRWLNCNDCCDPCQDYCNPCQDYCNPCQYSCNPCQTCNAGPRVWADGFGYYGRQDDKDELNGYKVNTWGTMLAVELPLVCGLRAGLGGGYAYTDLDERDYGNYTNIHNYQGTAYLTYDTDSWFLDGGFSYGWNRYDGTRHIVFTGINREARAKYNGHEYTGFATAGYQYYYCNNLEITPIASLLYSDLHIDEYKEKGADSLNLKLDKQHYKFLESSLGLKVAYLFKTNCGIFIPEIHSFWLHDYNDNRLNVDSSFLGLGAQAGSFSNIGPRIDRNTWNIGASVTCMSNDHFSIMAVYDYERSCTYFDHQGSIELSYDF